MTRLSASTVAVVALALGLLAATQVLYFDRGIVPGDAFVYLAAGERLNDGHDLYSLQPGDRPVDADSPYWSVPLVSPPPIAVIWRPLAALPGDLGVWVWYAAQLTALATTILMLLRRRPLLTAAAMLLLLFPTVYEIGVGNVNSFLLLGLVLTWRLSATDARGPSGWSRSGAAGAIAATMTAVKVTPGIVGWWFLVTGRTRAFASFIAAGVLVLAVSIAGAGLDAHLEYLRIIGDREAVGTSPLSLGGMARYVGMDPATADLLPTLAAVIGLATVWLTRRRPGLAFVVAVVTMILGSPAVSINWFVLLYAVLAPVAWPWPGVEAEPAAADHPAGRARIQPSSSA